MNNLSENVKKKLNDMFDNFLQKKSKEIIDMREKIDKKLGTYVTDNYQVGITPKTEKVKKEAGQVQNEN